MKIIKDALGNDIETGRFYGHSTRASGNVEVMVGRADDVFQDGRVKLVDVTRGSALYESEIHQTPQKRKIVTVTANSLFPVTDGVEWENHDD